MSQSELQTGRSGTLVQWGTDLIIVANQQINALVQYLPFLSFSLQVNYIWTNSALRSGSKNLDVIIK